MIGTGTASGARAERPGMPAGGRRPGHVLMTADAVGGVWRYSLDLAGALAARGVRTTLAVMGPPPDPSQRREARRAGASLVDRPFRLEWMEEPWEDVDRAGRWLLALERAARPDVIHLNGYAHAALPWSAPAMVVAHSCVCSWWRAVKREQAPERFDPYRRAVAAGLAAARRIVAPTAAMGAALLSEYEPGVSIDVIPNGIAGRRAAARAGKEPLVLAAGRAWDQAKNIAALASVAGGLSWPVCVAGDRHAPGASDRLPHGGVRALGRLTPGAMRAWYARAAIYALPARYEPFGLSVLEAAAARCALVLGDIPSLRENWDGAALFVGPDDREGLLAALRLLIADEARRDDLGKRAAARAAAFTSPCTAAAYLRLYEELPG